MSDSIQKTLLVALLLCIVCSVIVSTAAVKLKPIQQSNALIDKRKNIIIAAGLAEAGGISDKDVKRLFNSIEMKGIDLSTGEYVDIDKDYSIEKAAKDPKRSRRLKPKEDLADIRWLPNVMPVYLAKDKQNKISKIVLPVHGYGLWSTLYGFLALEPDANTVAGLGFYQHAETPGLGGEVDNPKWKALWPGKKIYEDGIPVIKLVKGGVDANTPNAEHKVDALSGATLTSRGVTNLLQFWMGDKGYGKYITRLKSQS